MVIVTDSTGSCKSNFHTITTITAPPGLLMLLYWTILNIQQSERTVFAYVCYFILYFLSSDLGNAFLFLWGLCCSISGFQCSVFYAIVCPFSVCNRVVCHSSVNGFNHKPLNKVFNLFNQFVSTILIFLSIIVFFSLVKQEFDNPSGAPGFTLRYSGGFVLLDL